MHISELSQHVNETMKSAADARGLTCDVALDSTGTPVASIEFQSGDPPRRLQVQQADSTLRWQISRGYLLAIDWVYRSADVWQEELDLSDASEEKLNRVAERFSALVNMFFDNSQYLQSGRFRIGR